MDTDIMNRDIMNKDEYIQERHYAEGRRETNEDIM